jgi:hypothetical protein
MRSVPARPWARCRTPTESTRLPWTGCRRYGRPESLQVRASPGRHRDLQIIRTECRRGLLHSDRDRSVRGCLLRHSQSGGRHRLSGQRHLRVRLPPVCRGERGRQRRHAQSETGWGRGCRDLALDRETGPLRTGRRWRWLLMGRHRAGGSVDCHRAGRFCPHRLGPAGACGGMSVRV